MWIFKTLRISWRSAWAQQFPASIRETIIAPEQMTEATANALGETRAHLNAFGFESQAILGQYRTLYPMETATELYLHESGRAMATVSFVRSATLAKTTVSISSMLEDGRVLVTTNRAIFDPPAGEEVMELFQAPMGKLWETHERRLREARAGVRIISGREGALDFHEHNEQVSWNGLVKRGILAECTAEEVEQAQRRLEAVASSTAAGGSKANADVMLEMADAMERKQTRRQALWAFAITLVLFVVAGVVWWDLNILWMLLVALIVHELGHYVTMRLFGFKNLKMIFVPLGGAAVIGRNFNVVGWKKAIVSLMGPLPGVLFGATCAVWAFRAPNEVRDEAAILALILNGLNLLPIYPLDGGAYLNEILFCRNAKLEGVFKAGAAVVLAAAAILMRDFILGALAYFLFMGLRPSFRLARFTERLRREVDIPCVDDPNQLPIEIRNRVIDGVKEAIGKPTSAKVIASHALGIFERLNARPPGVIFTLVLLFVYGATFGMAVVALGGITIAKTQHRASDTTPTIAWKCDGEPVEIPLRPMAPMLAVVTFTNSEMRGQFMEAARKAFPTNEQLVAGETVFMTYSHAQARKLNRLARMHSGELVVEKGRSSRERPVCYWSFSAPTEEAAVEIEREINVYGSFGYALNAYAPWAPRDAPATEDEKKARETFATLENVAQAATLESIKAMTNSPAPEEFARNWFAMKIAEVQRVAALNTNWDWGIVAFYTNYLAATNLAEFLDGVGREGAKRLGRAPKDEHSGTAYLQVERDGKNLRVEMEFIRAEQGLAAFGNWLCARGCSNALYTFRMF